MNIFILWLNEETIAKIHMTNIVYALSCFSLHKSTQIFFPKSPYLGGKLFLLPFLSYNYFIVFTLINHQNFASNFQISILPPLLRNIITSSRIMYCMHLASGMPHHLPYYFLSWIQIVRSSQGKNKWNMFGLIFHHSIHLFCS